MLMIINDNNWWRIIWLTIYNHYKMDQNKRKIINILPNHQVNLPTQRPKLDLGTSSVSCLGF